MKIQEIKKEIKRKQKEIENLQSQLDKTELIKIPELKIEVTKLKEWTKPYNEIVVPKGFRKIKVWELWFILESKYFDEVLGEFKNDYNYIWCEQTKYAKKNNYSSRLCAIDVGLGARVDDHANSFTNGRVVFVKEEELI